MFELRHSYPTRCSTLRLPPGLGDYLRGGIALAAIAREAGWCFRLDFDGHPIGRFLEPPAEPIATEMVHEFFDDRASLIYDWLDTIAGDGGNDRVARVCTNLLPHESRIDAGICEIIRGQLTFAKAVTDGATHHQRHVAGGEDFAVLHVRAVDADFRTTRAVSESLQTKIEAEVLPKWGRRVAVLSNNPTLREGICQRFGFQLLEGTTVHLGASDAGLTAVRDTLVDFALIGRSRQVFSYSDYEWKSGFSHWAATIYGVPFQSLRTEPPICPGEEAVRWAKQLLWRAQW